MLLGLSEYIEINHGAERGSKKAFCEGWGVTPQHLTKMIASGDFAVSDGCLVQIKKRVGGYKESMVDFVELAKHEIDRKLAKKEISFNSPESVRDYLKINLADNNKEVFAVMFLTQKHELINFEKMFNGTVNAAVVYPREVVKRALELDACAVILSHNHPTGDVEPSTQDDSMTRQVSSALDLVGIRVLDHVIVGRGEGFSYAESSPSYLRG